MRVHDPYNEATIFRYSQRFEYSLTLVGMLLHKDVRIFANGTLPPAHTTTLVADGEDGGQAVLECRGEVANHTIVNCLTSDSLIQSTS